VLEKMDAKTILLIILLVIVVIAAIVAIELRDLIYASIALAILSIALAGVFWILNAPWVALFQLMIYGGAVTVLLISTVALTERFESGEPIEDLDKLIETEEAST
jgi:NADH:ubiquinone oxidoreductase subunit 6 (subunit J)